MFQLYCNNLECRASPEDQAVVTTCSHIFCVPCANDLFATTSACPACQQDLSEPGDIVSTFLDPSNDYKSTILAGLSPATVMEIADRALNFWTYQMSQQCAFQNLLLKNTEKAVAYRDQQIITIQRQLGLVQHQAKGLQHELEEAHNRISQLSAQIKETDKQLRQRATPAARHRHAMEVHSAIQRPRPFTPVTVNRFGFTERPSYGSSDSDHKRNRLSSRRPGIRRIVPLIGFALTYAFLNRTMTQPLHTIPIASRGAHGPLTTKILFPLVFNLAQLGLFITMLSATPLLLIPVVGRRAFIAVIDYTKDGYGRLLILVSVLFGPTSLVLTTDSSELAGLVERGSDGRMTHLNLPDRLVIMANHQAYLDWMYIWILGCYSGNSKGIIILLKASLKKIPFVGWALTWFRFIFMHRSWAADREHLTEALTDLGRLAQSSQARNTTTKRSESVSLLQSAPSRSPLWLLIFPEGTITSDEERVKSVRYAEREHIDDLTTMLHPRSTGLLFCLRTLQTQVPDLQLLDMTIGYPGVPVGEYPQDYYGLFSVFLYGVPPPTVHVHLKLYNLDDVPSARNREATTKEENKDFELWLRGVWKEKEERLLHFFDRQRFDGGLEEVIPLRQLSWTDTVAAFGAGGLGAIQVFFRWLTTSPK